ncbi:outer membrane beta-barrel protein [Formosa sp. 4Alg 33]|uniref:outer membrane beta-barrel protein n=1 Tax=Formosa sp. 4Alg 33 TaxID=3382189 RepID=UPI003D9C1403
MYIKLMLLLFLCSSVCFSQDIQVSGSIKNVNDLPVDFANVILTNSEDATVVHGTTSQEDGRYILNNVALGSYILEISFIGYTTYKVNLEIERTTELGPIVLEESTEELATVNLVSNKPTFIKQSDRIIFNIEKTSLTEGSVMDVLRSTPGVLVMNDEISVKNNTNIIYLVNNKRVHLTGEDLQQLLAGTDASHIESVEVITNPSAKYDAEGAALININMSKNLITGYNGSLYANYTQGIYPRFNAGMNHFYKTEKLDIFANYSYGESELYQYNTSDVNFIENNTTIGTWHSENDRDTNTKSHNANANIDYAFNNANVLSFATNVNVTPYWKREGYMETDAVDSSFSSMNNMDDSKVNVAANLSYVNTSKSGDVFSVNLHHTNYDYDRYQDIQSMYFNVSDQLTRSNIFNSMSDQKTKIFSAQADYSMSFEQEIDLEFGVKSSVIDSKSGLDQYYLKENKYWNDEENSGIFEYNEINYAGYINASKAWETWYISAGLRGEFTDVEGEISTTNESNSFDYFKLFPTLNISKDFNENNSLGLSYGKRIERPTYSSLNPFKYYFNDYIYLQGNPNLQPTISHLTTLSYTLQGTYTFELYYRYEKDPTSELVFQDNSSNEIVYKPTNMEKSIDYGFDFLTFKPITGFWSVYFVNSIFHTRDYFTAAQSGNSTEYNETWSVYSNMMNFFTFLEDRSLSGEISVLYMAPMINGSSDVTSRTQVDLGVKKSFNNGKWVASLKASDIFRTTDFTVKNKYLNQDNQYYSRFDNQWFRLGLRYNFGNTRLTTNEKNEKELNERNRLNSEGSHN